MRQRRLVVSPTSIDRDLATIPVPLRNPPKLQIRLFIYLFIYFVFAFVAGLCVDTMQQEFRGGKRPFERVLGWVDKNGYC